jgi:hypothetical protein
LPEELKKSITSKDGVIYDPFIRINWQSITAMGGVKAGHWNVSSNFYKEIRPEGGVEIHDQ